MPDFHFPIFWTLFFETLNTLRQGLVYTMPGKHLIQWGTPLPTYSSHSFCFPSHPPNTQLKEKKKVFQSTGKVQEYLFASLKLKTKQNYYYCQLFRTENREDVLQKKQHTNTLACSLSLELFGVVLEAKAVSQLSRTCFLLSVFSPSALLFARQSSNPEKPSEHHTTVLRLS